MNRFLHEMSKAYPKFNNFDEHISWLKGQIKDSEETVDDINKEIESYKQEIEEVEAAKKATEENVETHKPSVFLNGWADSEQKKKEVYEWCQAHEILHHPEVVGNYYPNTKSPAHKNVDYEFITATSNTSKIRYVRCVDCYKKAIREGTENKEEYERYLKD